MTGDDLRARWAALQAEWQAQYPAVRLDGADGRIAALADQLDAEQVAS